MHSITYDFHQLELIHNFLYDYSLLMNALILGSSHGFVVYITRIPNECVIFYAVPRF